MSAEAEAAKPRSLLSWDETPVALGADAVQNKPSPHHQNSSQSQERDRNYLSTGTNMGEMKGCVGSVGETKAPGAGHTSVQGPAGGAGLKFH